MNQNDVKVYVKYIKELLFHTETAQLNKTALSEDTKELTEYLEFLGACIQDEKNYLTALAEGDIDSANCDFQNPLAAPGKNLQSMMKHLVWVAKRVTDGDYKQRVSMLGDFSTAFNEMIMPLERHHTEMERAVNTDYLTGTGNRRAYRKAAKKLWEEKHPFSMAFINIDNLKHCNSNYGYLEGDAYILSVCSKLQEICQDGETLYRMGGDEFLILSTCASAAELYDRLLQEHLAYQEDMQKKVAYRCDFSFGCADVDVNMDESVISKGLNLADSNMYDFKILNYMKHKHLKHYLPNSVEQLDKTGLDNRMFEVFCATSSNRYTYICNMGTNVSRWSLQAVRDFDLPSEYMYKADEIWETHIHPDDRDAFRKDIEAVFAGKKPYHNIDYRVKLKDGTYVTCTCEGCILKGKTPEEPDFFAGTLTNHGVIDYIDPITNLNNVYSFLKEIRHLRCKREGVTFLVIGIKQYSHINGAYGYRVGDLALRCFADYLYNCAPKKTAVFRLDGPNFVVVLPIEQQKKTNMLFRQIVHISETQIEVNGKRIWMSLCGASMTFEHIALTETSVLTELKLLLEEAKYSGTTELYQYDKEKSIQTKQQMRLLDTIKRDVLYGFKGFYLVYQPQVDRNKQVMGAECLLRWHHPEYGNVPPGLFIPWLEKDACFYTLSMWILRTAVREIRPLIVKHPSFILSVNVSYRQFDNAQFLDDVFLILKEENFPNSNLILEITEHCRSLNPQHLKFFMETFQRKGIRFSADDFGTGYSSFDVMRKLPFNSIKIDQSFIRDILTKPEDQIIVKSIIQCAKNRNLPVCVEGIETEEIYEFIKTLDPGYYQGYLFAKPLTVADLYAFVKHTDVS